MALANQVDEAKRAALSLQGRLSGLSGQAFESLLQVLIPIVKENVSDIANTTIDELMSILDKTVKIETLGTKNEAISFFIGEDEVKTGIYKVKDTVNNIFNNWNKLFKIIIILISIIIFIWKIPVHG